MRKKNEITEYVAAALCGSSKSGHISGMHAEFY